MGAKILPFVRGGWRGFMKNNQNHPIPLLAKEGIKLVTEGLLFRLYEASHFSESAVPFLYEFTRSFSL